MKTSNFLASALFGSLAAAAPLNKRYMHTFTSTVIQTEIVYTTVYAGDATPTSSPAAFYEQPSTPAAVSTSAAIPTVKPSSAAPVVPTAAPTIVKPSVPIVQPSSSSSASSSASSSSTTPAPVQPTTVVAPAQPAATSAPATQAATTATTASSGTGETHSGGSMTLNNFAGGLGSCGKAIADTDFTVALASDLYGASTYDVATGNPTSKWCGQKVAISYKGKTTTATIMDKCPGCTNGGFDMTPAVWKAVTGTDVGDRLYGMTWTTV